MKKLQCSDIYKIYVQGGPSVANVTSDACSFYDLNNKGTKNGLKGKIKGHSLKKQTMNVSHIKPEGMVIKVKELTS